MAERIQSIMEKFDEVMMKLLDAIDKAIEWMSKQLKRFW